MKAFSTFEFGLVLGLSFFLASRELRAQGPSEPPASVAPAHLEIPATDEGLPGDGPLRRSDWFKKTWLERRTQFAAATQKDQGAIVFLGDSITQGWSDVGSSFPGLKLANRGISGDTSRGVLIRLQEDVMALKPRGVVLLIGTNDLADKAMPEVVAANLKLIIEALKQRDPSMPVVLCAVFPSSASQGRPFESIQKTNALYLQAMADQPQVTVLDTWSLFANSHGDAKEEEMPDLLHPNLIGYAKWASALRPIFETLGLTPGWSDEFAPETGFTTLFNGQDLTGWGYVGGPNLTGKADSDDGRYIVKNGRLVVTAAHKGQSDKQLLTVRQFPRDFVLKLEFRASPNADSGIFVRGPQLQCRDFTIAGPFSTLAHYRSLDWNEIVVIVRGGLAHCTCNGEIIVDAMPVPATGGIGLESDHGQVEYRRIRLHESR